MENTAQSRERAANIAVIAAFRCFDCGKPFDSLAECRNHIAVLHLEWVRYSCYYCSEAFEAKDDVKAHLKQRHRDEPFWYVVRHCPVKDGLLKSKLRKSAACTESNEILQEEDLDQMKECLSDDNEGKLSLKTEMKKAKRQVETTVTIEKSSHQIKEIKSDPDGEVSTNSCQEEQASISADSADKESIWITKLTVQKEHSEPDKVAATSVIVNQSCLDSDSDWQSVADSLDEPPTLEITELHAAIARQMDAMSEIDTETEENAVDDAKSDVTAVIDDEADAEVEEIFASAEEEVEVEELEATAELDAEEMELESENCPLTIVKQANQFENGQGQEDLGKVEKPVEKILPAVEKWSPIRHHSDAAKITMNGSAEKPTVPTAIMTENNGGFLDNDASPDRRKIQCHACQQWILFTRLYEHINSEHISVKKVFRGYCQGRIIV